MTIHWSKHLFKERHKHLQVSAANSPAGLIRIRSAAAPLPPLAYIDHSSSSPELGEPSPATHASLRAWNVQHIQSSQCATYPVVANLGVCSPIVFNMKDKVQKSSSTWHPRVIHRCASTAPVALKLKTLPHFAELKLKSAILRCILKAMHSPAVVRHV